MIRAFTSLSLISALAASLAVTPTSTSADFKVPASNGNPSDRPTNALAAVDHRPGRVSELEDAARDGIRDAIATESVAPSGIGVDPVSIPEIEIQGVGPGSLAQAVQAPAEVAPPKAFAVVLPEPASLLMMGVGVVFALGYRRVYHARRAA